VSLTPPLLLQWDHNLIAINPQQHAIMAVDWPNEQTSYGRQAVRISSQWSFNVGSLLILCVQRLRVGLKHPLTDLLSHL
jgi:hypothetical protein